MFSRRSRLAGNLGRVVVLMLSALGALLSADLAHAQPAVTPTSAGFNLEPVGTPAPAVVITLKNSQAAALTISGIAPSAGFTVASTSCPISPATLGATFSCTVNLGFTPTQPGLTAGTVTITENLGTLIVPLAGFGTTGGNVSLSAPYINFPSTVVSATSATQSIAFTNKTTHSINVSAVQASANFGIGVNGCLGTILSGASCTVSADFIPTTTGALTGALSFTESADANPILVLLGGTGLPAASVAPTMLSFPGVAVGTPSAVQYVMVTNSQSTAMTISALSNPGSGFVASSACGSLPVAVAAGGTCKIGVVFTPTAVAPASATLAITSNSPAPSLMVALSGTGAASTTISPAAANFGNVSTGSTSTPLTVTLKNNEATPITVSSVKVSTGSPFSILPASTCLTPALAGNASCTVLLSYVPSTSGLQTATLSIVTSLSPTAQTVPISGSGVLPVTLTPGNTSWTYTPINTTGVTNTLTLRNYQTAAMTINSVLFGGPYALSPTPGATTCPVTGGSLAGGATCTIGVVFKPTATGLFPGQITVNDTAPNSPQTATFAGTATLATTISPLSANFYSVAVGATSTPLSFMLSNFQAVPLNLTSITVPAPYAVAAAGTTCKVGTPIASISSCTINLTYTPTAVDVQPAAMMTIVDDAVTSPTTVPLQGTGIAPVTLSAAGLNFGNTVDNVPVIQKITLKNAQAVPLTISSITGLSAPYTLDPSSTCPLIPSAVPAGASCVIAVNFKPTTLGGFVGTVKINDDAPSATQSFALQGFGILPVAISPNPVFFTTQYEGIASPVVPVSLKNQQLIPLTISGITITGANSADFNISGTSCPTSPSTLAAGVSCGISLTFTPSGPGLRIAALNIMDDAPGAVQTIPLEGNGNAPVQLTPITITNFTAPVGTTSTYQTIVVKNNNTSAALHIAKFQFNGDFVQTSTTCPIAPSGLASGASCNVTVSFAPSIGGTRSGQLLVYDDAVTSPQAVNLQGIGTSPLTITPASLTYSAQKLSTVSPPKPVTLTNQETQSETFSFITTGDFAATTNCPSGVIAAKSSCQLTVTFDPTATGPRNGSLTVTHSAAVGSPLVVSLLGSGTTANPPAAVQVVSPGAGTVGTTVNAIITGNGWTNFSPASVVTFDAPSGTIPSGIAVTVPAPAATTANKIMAQFVISGAAIPGARNIRIVTPLSGGGSETALLTAAFIIADTSNSHTITNLSPNFGTQGKTLNVNLTATGTNFASGVTFANFGDGIVVNSLNVLSLTTAQANITISNTSFTGPRTVTLVTGGEVATSATGAFTIQPNTAALVGVSPTSGAQGANLAVTLTGTGTHWLQNATGFTFTGGINVGNVQVTSLTTATANIAVTQGATVGLQNITVATGGEIASLNNAFTVIGATPHLVSVTPGSAQQGQTTNIELIGQYTTFSAANILADFGGDITVNSYNVKSATDVVVNITVSQDAAVTSRTANLTSGPGASATIFPFTFSVTPSSASIFSVTPSSVPQGGQVVLTVVGSNTHWVQGTTTAAFSPIPTGNIVVNEVKVIDATHATLNISVSTDHPVGGHGFYMATGGEVVNASISVYAQTPTLSVSPANGMPGSSASVSFTGQFTHFSPSTFAVVSGQGVTLQNFSVTSLVGATAKVVIAPGAATGLRTITFTTGGEIVTTFFNVTTTPVYLLTISPYHSPQNNTLNVEIIGANTHFLTGSTVVNFDPSITVNSTTIKSATDLIANITVSPTAAIGYHTAYVNTGAEQVIIGFAVDGPALPSLVSVTPSSGAQGAVENVTITGSLTHFVAGQTEAILGAGVTVSNFTVTSPTTATATISVSPTAPVGGNSVILITGQEIVSGAGFSVTPNSATISIVQPSCNSAGVEVTLNPCGGSGSSIFVVSQLQTINLAITGVGTHWLQGETTANFGPGVVTDSINVLSPTSATVQITVLSSAPVGFAPLTMTTDGEVVTLQQAIDIEQGFPVLLSTSPAGGQQGATLNLQLLGRFTTWQQGVTNVAFNQDITVNSVTVLDSVSAIANITISPLAYHDLSCSPSGHTVTITTGTEQVSLPGTFCVALGAAQITNVAPATGYQGSTGLVTIAGSATHFTQGITTANFGPGINVGDVTVLSPTSATVAIAVTTSAPTGYASVTLNTLGEIATQQFAYQVTPGVATLNEAIPNQAEQGVQNLNVHLIGQYSHFSASSTATFGAGITVNSITYTDATDLTANITLDPLSYTGGRTVTVTTPGVPCAVLVASLNACSGAGQTTGSEIVTDNAFNIIPGPAIITTVAPNTGNQGQEIVFNITGSGTHWSQNITQFYFPGAGSDITINAVVINSPTSATVDLSISPTAGLGTRSVYMVTAGEALVDSGAFVITGGIPTITYLSPNNAQPGTNQLDVTIHGVYTAWDNTTTVDFGPGIVVTKTMVENSTTIDAVINIDPAATQGYRTIFVRTGTQGLTSNFQVYTPPPPVPYISYFVPSSGLPGQTFTVSFTGANTHWDPATTQPTFGDGITINTFQVTSPTSAIANITISPSASAGSRLFTLTTGSEVDSTYFNVVISVPTLSLVDPGSGLQGTTSLDVNVIGQFTVFDNTTVFNFGQGITVNSAIVRGPTVATVNISIAQLAQLGGRGVTATTAGATVGGAGFSVTPSLALISSISPNTALQGTTVTVDVQGTNTHWNASTTFSFGAGIVVASATVNSPTDATLVLSLPALASLGATGATAQTLGEVANITNGFVVQPGTPLLLSSGPGSLPQQSSATFTILSQATTWLANPPTVDFGAGITLTSVNVTSDTSLTVKGLVVPTTNVGYRNLTVSTGAQVLTLSNAVYVSPGPAVVNSVSPSTGGQGGTYALTITGINTHWQQGVTSLSFPEVLVNSFTVTSPTTASANVTVSTYANPGLVTISMTTLGEVATESNAFEITQTQPELIYISPATVMQGVTRTVTITSLYTHFGPTTTASFGPGVTVNSVAASTTTSLQVNLTVAPTTTLGARSVSITTGSEVVASTSLFQVATGPAAVATLSPAAGGQGKSLTVLVTGSQTNFGPTTVASFSGGITVTGIAVVDALHTNVMITIPASVALGTYNVTMTTGGEVATILGGFTVGGGTPVLSVVNPPTGHQGDTSTSIALTGQFTNFVNGTSVANFGAGITVISTTVTDSTHATAKITISPSATIASRTVTVTTGAEVASITGGFSVLAGTPALTSATPGTAQAGTSANIVITGAFTNFQQGFSTVNLGSGVTVNSVTVSSFTQLTANITVTTNATVGSRDINVTTSSQNVTLSAGFMVLAGTPVITQINPNVGTPGASVSVTLYGQYTNWGATTKVSFGPSIAVGGAAEGVAGPVTVTNATTLTASLVLDAAAALGPRDVTVTTGAEVDTVAGGFTVQSPTIAAPTVLSISPGENAGGMPSNSTIIVVFSEPMSRPTITAANILLYLTSNQNNGSIPVAGTVNLDASGRIMTFTPTAPLAVNSTFSLQLSSAIQSAGGASLGNYYTTLYSDFTANTTPPTVLAVNPPVSTLGVGTNVAIQVQFSVDMDQATQTGLTVNDGTTNIAGTYSWNSAVNCCSWGPGTILTFTPAATLTANHTYTVSYGSPLADTAGNNLVAGSFTFKTGAGPDTTNNQSFVDYTSFEGNLGTNFTPVIHFAKPIDTIDVNAGTLFIYNYDTGKYLRGTVAVAPNGLSAKFTPAVPLLPQTAYDFHMSSGNYDMDGNYEYGTDNDFVTGASSDTTPPTVASVDPANSTTAIPLNANIVVHFNEPIDNTAVSNIITVTPAGGAAIAGTATFASDQVTLTFTPNASLTPNKVYTVLVSGFHDITGLLGTTSSTTFTTANSVTPLNLSTGFTTGGTVSTVGGTPDASWTVTVGSAAPVAAEVVAPGETGWYSGWQADGPGSSWIVLNPNSVTGNTFGTYSRTFNLTGYSLSNLCLVGSAAIDDNGSLVVNGVVISGNISSQSLTPINLPLSAANLVAGVNTLSLQWGSTDNYYEAFRLQATIQTCGAYLANALSVTSSTPAANATNVPTNSTIVMNFSNALDPATVNASTIRVLNGYNGNEQIAGSFAVTGSQVTFTPSGPLPVSSNIYVTACNGPTDIAGDTYGSCYVQLFNFQTASTVAAAPAPFQITAFTPTNGATNIGVRAPVVATFNRSFNPGTVNGSVSDFSLYAGDSVWCQSYSRSQDNATLNFNCGAMPASSTMTALVNSNLQDMTGNGVAPFRSQFTTAKADSPTAGSIVSVHPANGATSIPVNQALVLYTSLPIDPSTANAGLQVAQNNVPLSGTVQVLDGGYTLQFTPGSNFTPGALVQWWTTSSLADATYNSPFNTTNGFFTVAASMASAVPAIQVASPSLYSNGVALNSIFDFQFNTPLDPSTVTATNIYLYDSHTGLNVPATYSMPQPNEVRLVPTTEPSPSSYIYLYVTTGLHSSTSVPAVATNPYFYTGTADDTSTPTIVSAVPFNGATNVGVNISPGVAISKAIDPVTVNSTTFQVTNAGTPLAGTYFIATSDAHIQFVPNAPLPASTTLKMTLAGVLDNVGHTLNYSSTFTTAAGPDFTAPTVLSTSIPSNGSVPLNSVITIQFSESMDITTFTSNNLRIYDNTLNVTVPATLTWSADQSIAYLTPTSPLAAGRHYNLYVNSGTDLAGNALSGTNFNFYGAFTSSSTAPTVTLFNPVNGLTGVGLNAVIEAQFSAVIDPGTIANVKLTRGGVVVPATVTAVAGNTTVQLVPQSPLLASTAYLFTIAGVKDPAGNTVTTITSSFTTQATDDLTAPVLVNYNPPNNSIVGTNVIPRLIFNKALNPLTVNSGTFRMLLTDTNQYLPVTVTPSASGLAVTVQPQVALLPSTQYRIQACCSYQDANGNNGGEYDLYFKTNAGPDTTAPTVTVSPIASATAVPLNSVVIVAVNEPMDPTSWTQTSVQVLNPSNTPVAGTVTQPDAMTLVFTPTTSLLASTTYTVKISGFKDAAENTVATTTSSFTTGTVASTAGLTLTSTNIPYNSTGVSATQPIILTFSQVLDPTTVNSATLKVMNTYNSYESIAGTYVVNGNQVTFTPANPYPAGTNVTMGECGGPTDILGEVFQNGNCYAQELVSFTVTTGTPDTTPLTVLSVNPAAGSTSTRLDVPVSVTFNKSINPYTISSTGSAILFSGQGVQDNNNVTLSADNRTLTFNSGVLNSSTIYTIQLAAGAISDYSGNKLANTFSSSFTTGTDPTTGNGSVQGVTPNFNATGVPTSSLLTLYVNRPVNPSTVPGALTVTVNGAVYAGTVQAVASGYEIQFTPTVAFPTGAVVQWFFSGAYDTFGNAFNGNSGTFYMVTPPPAATTVPTLVTQSPTYYSTSVPVNGLIDLQFNIPIDASTLAGNITINPTIGATITLSSPTVIHIVPTTSFTPATTYYVCTSGSIKGTNGVAAQSACYATYFATTSTGADTTSGTVKIGPPNNSVGVGTNAYLRFVFSKPIDQTTVTASTITVSSGGTAIPGTFSFVNSSNNVLGVNFSPINPLPPSTVVTVSVKGVLDYAGNSFTNTTTSFTTAALPDYTSPTVTLDFPYGQTGVANNASFTCRYSEPIDPSSINPSNTYVYSYIANASVPSTYTFSSDMMSVTMTPVTTLFANSQYDYTCNGAIDLTGNGQQNGSEIFYTGGAKDTAGPLLVTANPPNGATNVAINTNEGPWNSTSLGLLFNKPINYNSLNGITITPQGGTAIPVALFQQDGDAEVSIQLGATLVPNTKYTYSITGATDLAGNLIAPVTSSFTTGSAFDYSNPTVTTVLPANSATGIDVASTAKITFTEPMNPILIDSAHFYLRTHNTQVTVPGTVTLSADDLTVTITPTTALTPSTIYDVVLVAPNWYLTDFAGNPFYNYGVQSTFTTGVATALNGACGTANGSSFSTPPTTNLCSAGTAGPVTNPNTYNWTCIGTNGGTTSNCSATATLATACYATPASLVSMWSGTDTPNDSVSTNNGTLENGVTYALGEVGDAFSFNAANQYVLIGDPVPANLQIQNAITLQAWIYVTQYPVNNGSGALGFIMGSQYDTNTAGATIFYDGNTDSDGMSGVPPGHIQFQIGDGAWHETDTLTQVPQNQWVLITATRTANNPAQIYYNGVLQPSNSVEPAWTGAVKYTGAWFAIGQQKDYNRAFNGLIDEAQIYNAALTQAQVTAVYNAGKAGVCP